MTFKTRGIIINKYDFRDYDRKFVFYTKEHGKIEAMGQGTRKISSKLSGSLELFTIADITIAKAKQIDRITTVDVSTFHSTILADFDRQIAASYCLEIFNQMVKWEERDEVLFTLLFDFLTAMNSEKKVNAHLFACAFVIKLFTHLGYTSESIAEMTNSSILIQKAKKILQQHLDKPLKTQVFFDRLTEVVK